MDSGLWVIMFHINQVSIIEKKMNYINIKKNKIAKRYIEAV